jgi:hypothetical protein
MRPDEAPEAKYDRLKRKLQDSILSEYPNPERKGCPGDLALRELAKRSADEGVEADANWQHVTHCSECYREFLDRRLKFKSAAKRRGQVVWAVAAAAVFLVAVGLFLARRQGGSLRPERPQNAEVAYNKSTIDIPEMARSDGERANRPIFLERKPDELTVNLPVGSKAGEYEFQLLRGDGLIVKAHANAEIHNGTTAFTVRIDLSRVEAGQYSMNVRQVPWDWNYVPVVVR